MFLLIYFEDKKLANLLQNLTLYVILIILA